MGLFPAKDEQADHGRHVPKDRSQSGNQDGGVSGLFIEVAEDDEAEEEELEVAESG